MPIIDDAIVERVAKELAEMDGREWSIEFIPVRPGERIRLTLSLSERRAYQERARRELSRGRDDIGQYIAGVRRGGQAK